MMEFTRGVALVRNKPVDARVIKVIKSVGDPIIQKLVEMHGYTRNEAIGLIRSAWNITARA